MQTAHLTADVLPALLLDAPMLTNLMYLDLVRISKHVKFDVIETIVNGCPHLLELGIAEYENVTLKHAIMLLQHPSIIDLTLRDCEITDDIAEVLFTSDKIRYLCLGGNRITGSSLRVAAYNYTLDSLSLWYNKKMEGKYIVSFVTQNTTLLELHVEGTCELDLSFVDSLKLNSTLTALRCTFKDEIQNTAVQQIINECTTIQRLVLETMSESENR